MAEEIKVAKNTLIYTSALILQKIFSFVYFAIVARWIGVAGVGKYTFALSLSTVFAIFIDFGLSSLLIREVAKDPKQAKQNLSNILGLKAAVAVVIYLLLCGAVNLLHYPELTRQLVYLSGVVMVIDAITLNFYAVLRGYHNLKYESYGAIINQLVVIVSGLIFLFLGLSLHFLLVAYILGSLFNFSYAAYYLHRRTGIWPSLTWSWPSLKPLLILATPFLLAGIFSRVYGYADILLLSKLASEQAVGWYSVAYKLTFAFQFLPLAFLAAIFPAMSNYYVNDKSKLANLFEQSVFYLLLISLPIAAGIFALAPELILRIYGQAYLPSVPALRILILSLPFLFLNFPLGSVLNSCNRQNKNTANLGVAMVASIAANLALIPWYNFIGSALAALFTNFLLCFLGFYQVNKILPYRAGYLWRAAGRLFFCCLVMLLAVLALKSHCPLPISVASGAVIFVALIFITKLMSVQMLEGLRQSLRK